MILRTIPSLLESLKRFASPILRKMFGKSLENDIGHSDVKMAVYLLSALILGYLVLFGFFWVFLDATGSAELTFTDFNG